MKRTLFALLFIFNLIKPAVAQQFTLDSIVKVVTARNLGKKINSNQNTDSLFKRLPVTKPGSGRVYLIYHAFDVFANDKQNIEMGYRILAWAKAHHDEVSVAVIASEMGTVMSTTGDKATGSQLESDALAAAIQSGDNQALGIVYQNSFARSDFIDSQLKYYALKALKFSMAANDVKRIGWDYTDLGEYYNRLKKTDSAIYYFTKSLDWAIRANSIFDVCNNLYRIGYLQNNDKLRERYLKYAFKIAELTNDRAAISNSAAMLGNYYYGKNDIDTALAYADKAYRTGLKLAPDFRLSPAQLVSKIYLKKKNIDSTVKYTTIYFGLHEQVNNNESMIRAQAINFNQKQKQQQSEAAQTALRNIQLRWILGVVIVFLLLIAFIFWRNNRLSRKANTLLASQKLQTEFTLAELRSAQQQLIQSEKMASLGELTAGIAHEIQNPLNFVNNFSEVSAELIDEMNEELEEGDIAEAKEIAADVKRNLEKIRHHGNRAESIVKGMLEHSRASTGLKEPTDLNKLAEEYLRLAYHGLRAKDKSFNAELVTHFDANLPDVNLMQQDMGRVLLNVFNNAFYAIGEKVKIEKGDYKPEVTVRTSTVDGQVIVEVKDNGSGIPDAIKDKIMQPFFTTKPTGQGTGLGLSLSYEIVVKGHGGQLNVTSRDGEYTAFTIAIPI